VSQVLWLPVWDDATPVADDKGVARFDFEQRRRAQTMSEGRPGASRRAVSYRTNVIDFRPGTHPLDAREFRAPICSQQRACSRRTSRSVAPREEWYLRGAPPSLADQPYCLADHEQAGDSRRGFHRVGPPGERV
jgi:hypothetical protein